MSALPVLEPLPDESRPPFYFDAFEQRVPPPFDLDAFADQSQSFVARKTHEGRSLAVLERPGLWNGSMAGWNTLAVEVPSATFTQSSHRMAA